MALTFTWKNKNHNKGEELTKKGNYWILIYVIIFFY